MRLNLGPNDFIMMTSVHAKELAEVLNVARLHVLAAARGDRKDTTRELENDATYLLARIDGLIQEN